MLSDEKILELYKDINFPGSFSGVKVFKQFLKTELNESVSEKRLYSLLKNDQLYVTHLKAVRHYPQRPYFVTSFGQLCQCDLAFMRSFNNFSCFLLLIDVFSRHLYAKPLKNKSGILVERALKEIFSQFETPISCLETDSGGEFIYCKKLFKSLKIHFRTKTHSDNKANFSEHAIFLVKRKLYLMMEELNTNNWPELLPRAIEQLNNRPMAKLGNIKPAEINSFLDDVKIRQEQKKNNVEIYEQPTYNELEKNQIKYEDSLSEIQQGVFVYLQNKKRTFQKSYLPHRGQIYKVRRVDAGVKPVMFELEDLMGHKVDGLYYEQQLKLAPNPDREGFFEVNKIESKRLVNGKKYALVSYKNYPPKFNQWVLEENISFK